MPLYVIFPFHNLHQGMPTKSAARMWMEEAKVSEWSVTHSQRLHGDVRDLVADSPHDGPQALFSSVE